MQGGLFASGQVGIQVHRGVPARVLSARELLPYALPRRGLLPEVFRWRVANMRHFWRGLRGVLAAEMLRLPTLYGRLSLTVIRADGQVVPYGLASLRVVTDVGVGFIVDAFQNSVELEIMKFHGIGTGNTAENAADTDIETELTTEYQTDNTRATGSLTEGATANIFRTVGTNTVDGAVAIVEHGILSSATVGSGVLLDRSVFSTINLGSGDSLQTTYDLTLSAGG